MWLLINKLWQILYLWSLQEKNSKAEPLEQQQHFSALRWQQLKAPTCSQKWVLDRVTQNTSEVYCRKKWVKMSADLEVNIYSAEINSRKRWSISKNISSLSNHSNYHKKMLIVSEGRLHKSLMILKKFPMKKVVL